MTFSTISGVIETLWCSFRFVLEGKIGKEIPESSRLEFFKKFLANNFALSDTEGNTSGPLNRGSIADLPLLRTLLAICQKSREPSLWEVMDCFISIWKFGSSTNLFTAIASLPELYFRFRRFTVGKNGKSDFYELWQHNKQLKTI